MRKGNPFSVQQWLAWLCTSVAASISIVVFFYQHFETKESIEVSKKHQEQFNALLEKRLDRIENKVDQILFK